MKPKLGCEIIHNYLNTQYEHLLNTHSSDPKNTQASWCVTRSNTIRLIVSKFYKPYSHKWTSDQLLEISYDHDVQMESPDWKPNINLFMKESLENFENLLENKKLIDKIMLD